MCGSGPAHWVEVPAEMAFELARPLIKERHRRHDHRHAALLLEGEVRGGEREPRLSCGGYCFDDAAGSAAPPGKEGACLPWIKIEATCRSRCLGVPLRRRPFAVERPDPALASTG
ncbi:MAG: hypothetical protein AVDCRST_MAG77-3652 [uncultured Chloroflexi bacterium]|uniref:Uncharacterized protein n=1 Tax=uncultured Chloroflexota bacterium TaxID=166587 RepID=A0A6J4JJC2_9CHLR|nr:MAG: hypothetical protein AVDCRST_MAG77-3652 [uncultured Chloroflexota bacterium]